MKIFIAGPRAIKKIPLLVEQRLENILENGHTVLVGDANGIDKSIQNFFAKKTYTKVNVFASNGKARNNILGWDVTHVAVDPKTKGFDFYAAKDKKMAEEADFGLMVWNGESKGTLNNVVNLTNLNKKAIVYFVPRNEFASITNNAEIESLLAHCDKSIQELYRQLLLKKTLASKNKLSTPSAIMQNIPLTTNTTPTVEQLTFDLPSTQPIKGFPELRWAGKRPFTATHYFPAQLKESYGDSVDAWRNRIYWGDNLQVMSHLLKEFRGKVDLIYIDPPFDSKADYKKKISLYGNNTKNDITPFEEKQYTDIWSNDEYLQFIYERVILIKEMLSEQGFIVIQCDWKQSHCIKLILDEVLGQKNFRGESIVKAGIKNVQAQFEKISSITQGHNSLFVYSKSHGVKVPTLRHSLDVAKAGKWDTFWRGTDRPTMRYEIFGVLPQDGQWRWEKNRTEKAIQNFIDFGMTDFEDLDQYYLKYLKLGLDLDFVRLSDNGVVQYYVPPQSEKILSSLWTDIPTRGTITGYPTEKNESIAERLVTWLTTPNSIVFDCFMGSGTTQAVAMKLGRRFIGADINLGAIQTTTKRLNTIIKEKKADRTSLLQDDPLYLNFEVYNVNNYDVFRNPVQAKELLIQALEIDPLTSTSDVFDGMKDGYKVKIMPVNRIATRADLNPIITGINYRELNRRMENTPGKAVERIMLVCMGHEPDLAANLKMEIGTQYRLDVDVVDILREKERGLTFKYDAEACIEVEEQELIIRQFYPRNLLQKLSILDENVEEWRELVETIAIDWNYNGEVLQPVVYDSPGKNTLVQGRYPIPADHGIIRVKITDLLSESLEVTIEVD